MTHKKDTADAPVGTGLFVASCSVTMTRRRRYLWAAWWTAPPTRLPFRKPDAFSGGALSHDDALAEARRASAVPLVEIEPRWARAWTRVLIGQAPWTAREVADIPSARAAPAPAQASANAAAQAPSIWETLGVPARVTAVELKRAFRQRALATHPDRGGDPAAFRAVQAAFKEAQRRLARRARPRSRARR